MRGTIVLGALAGLLGLGGCISSTAETPEWFSQRSAEADSSYPTLRSVPREIIANTDAAHWRAVERDVVAAGEAMKANPRAQAAGPTEDPSVFLEQAREDLEETRQSHEP